MARILAVANQKGGVGKTTTAVNLAASLAAAEKKVLLIDIDPQANASSGLGRPAAANEPCVYHALLGEADLRSVIRETELPQLKIAASSADLTGAEVELVTSERREHRLAEALGSVASDYDYIFIDTPPSLGLLTLNALVGASDILIPMQCEYYALEGIGALVGTIERVRTSLNPGLSVGGVLLCMYDPRANLTKQVELEVRGHFGNKVFDTTVPRNVRVSESPSFGKPILLYDIASRGAQAYLELAREFLGREQRKPGPVVQEVLKRDA